MARTLSRSERRADGISAVVVEALVDRVVKSPEFANSPRSQEVLRYLCRSALSNPEVKISEHRIGVSVFGWNPDQDPGNDTIVRVQISQLRRKLDHYFASDGQDEPIAIHVPRGSYSPVFEIRDAAAAGVLPIDAAKPPETVGAAQPGPGRFAFRLLVITNVVTALLALALALLPRAPTAEATASPALDRFWKPFHGRPAQVVLSDGNLLILSEMLGRDISLDEYRSHFNPTGVVTSSVPDQAIRTLANRILITHMTGVQDADVVGNLSTLLARYHVPASTISAQDFRIPQPDNLILLGHSRINPWVRLFEDRLNFQYEFDWKNRKGQIVNRSPAPGEQAVYTADFGSRGYCVVACLPKPAGEGTALLIYGSDMSSLQAGGRFVTDERWMALLYNRLGATPKNAPPYFEVLLRTKLLDGVAREFDVAAYRLPSIEPVQPRTVR